MCPGSQIGSALVRPRRNSVSGVRIDQESKAPEYRATYRHESKARFLCRHIWGSPKVALGWGNLMIGKPLEVSLLQRRQRRILKDVSVLRSNTLGSSQGFSRELGHHLPSRAIPERWLASILKVISRKLSMSVSSGTCCHTKSSKLSPS